MKRRDALKQILVGGSSLLVLNDALMKRTFGNPNPASTLTINIDSVRFGALKNINGTVEITNAMAPGIQNGMMSQFPLALVRVNQTTVSAVETYCMHQGCQVNKYDGTQFLCGCHGSQYTATGAVKKGPTTAPLKSYPVTLVGNIVTVSNLPGNTSWNLTSAEDTAGPTAFELRQNYPNPFGAGSSAGAAETRITFAVGAPADLHLSVHDAAGRAVATLAEGRFEPGIHTVNFSAAYLPAGVYFYTLRAGSYAESKRMQILK